LLSIFLILRQGLSTTEYVLVVNLGWPLSLLISNDIRFVRVGKKHWLARKTLI